MYSGTGEPYPPGADRRRRGGSVNGADEQLRALEVYRDACVMLAAAVEGAVEDGVDLPARVLRQLAKVQDARERWLR
jgi:hypothetical protein